MKEQTVPVEDVILDERCQARATIDPDTIREYAEAYKAKTKLPPVDVFRVAGKLYLVDGFHRFAALRSAGDTFARVRVVGDGSLDEAVWHATSVNATHGLKRTNADKRRAVTIALRSAIGCEQSSRTIAEHVGVDHKTVERVRAEIEDVGNFPTSPKTRTDKLGRQQPAKRPRRDVGKSATSEPQSSAPEIDSVDDVPDPLLYPHEKGPTHGAALLEAAGIIRRARLEAMRHAGPEAHHAWQRAESLLRDAEKALTLAEPVMCPKCGGKGCVPCRSRGWRERSEVAA